MARVYGRRGKQWLRQQIGGYRNASAHAPWFVLVDLDRDECPPQLRRDWGSAERGLCFRVAVHAAESWLLADRDGLANFLGVARGTLPDWPDATPDPRRALIDAASRSRRGSVRDAIVSRSGARQGPLYSAELGRFVDERWDAAAATGRSPSLDRCRRRLAELIARA